MEDSGIIALFFSRSESAIQEVREVTWKEGGGWVDDGQGKLHSMPWRVEGTIGDTLTVDYYNWDDEVIGTLVFKLR